MDHLEVARINLAQMYNLRWKIKQITVGSVTNCIGTTAQLTCCKDPRFHVVATLSDKLIVKHHVGVNLQQPGRSNTT